LAGEIFKSQAKVSMVHVPYAGAAQAQLGLLFGQVDLNFDSLAAASSNIGAGRLKALAVTTAQRSSVMPELPTIAESGLPEFAIDTWFGLFAPGGTPADVVQRLNEVFVKALQEPEVKARFARLMIEPSPTTPTQFGDFVKAELAKYEKLVKASGVSLN
jgi:tripartite-type tricarboxylate transporter receptor subunit TctC